MWRKTAKSSLVLFLPALLVVLLVMVPAAIGFTGGLGAAAAFGVYAALFAAPMGPV